MRTLGEFKQLKANILDRVLEHPEMAALLNADPFRGKWPNPARLEIHCHWDQSVSLLLTETALSQECFGTSHFKRVVLEAIPQARVFGMDCKNARTLCLRKTRITFSVPEGVTLDAVLPSARNESVVS